MEKKKQQGKVVEEKWKAISKQWKKKFDEEEVNQKSYLKNQARPMWWLCANLTRPQGSRLTLKKLIYFNWRLTTIL